jgi:glycosyltransferase involved in cell wall biosynthesis
VARLREAPWRLFASGTFAAGALARLGALGKVDRVVAHWIVPCAFPLALAVRAPLSVHAHGADVRLLLGVPRDVRERVLGALLSREATLTFAAAALRSALLESVEPDLAARLEARAHVEPPAIDLPDVAAHARELRASLGLAEDERLAVTACRLIASKRVELSIDALREARGLRGVIVGDGPEREALEKRAAGGPITFTGALPRREALAWIAAADVLLHPSAVEAAPTVVREARALGVPVVACDAGDIAAWAADDDGLHVARPSAGALVEALAAALSASTTNA